MKTSLTPLLIALVLAGNCCAATAAQSSAPPEATYITQTTNSSLANAQALSALSTGLVKVTTTTGVLSTAASGTDYLAPSGALGTPSSGTLTNCTGFVFERQILLSSSFSPADATTYYFGAATGQSQAAGFQRIYITKNCTLNSVYGWLQGGNGSSETSTMSIRVNNTTDTTIRSDINCSAISGVMAFNATGLGVTLSAGDYIEIKWVTPTWVTNPTSVNGAFSLGFSTR